MTMNLELVADCEMKLLASYTAKVVPNRCDNGIIKNEPNIRS